MTFPSLSIRWRLTLWYGVSMALIYVVAGTGLYALTARDQLARVDFELSEEMNEFEHDVRHNDDRQTLLTELNAEFSLHEHYEFEITQRDGSAFFQSQRLTGQRLFSVGEWPADVVTELRELPGLGEYRVLGKAIESQHGSMLLQAAIPLAPIRAAQQQLLRTLSLIGPVMLLAVLAGGYVLARRALDPVQRMVAAAERITAQRLDQRLAESPVRDELSQLAHTLNEMIGRLDRSFAEMRRFTADAAHELRTPLTLLRTQLDVALLAPRSTNEYQAVLVSLRDDTVRLCDLAAQLLELSREDAGIESANFEPVRLDHVLSEVIAKVSPVTQSKQITLVAAPLPACEIVGDHDRLERVFVNLLDNAVKHTPAGGRITIGLASTSESLAANGHPLHGFATATISDTGCGIAPEHVPHLFDRFYRVDPARTTNGSGLGLAICRGIVTAHRGEISLQSQPGCGTIVSVQLPCADKS